MSRNPVARTLRNPRYRPQIVKGRRYIPDPESILEDEDEAVAIARHLPEYDIPLDLPQKPARRR